MSAREHAGAGEKRRGLGGVVVWVAGGVGCRWRLAWRRVQRTVDIVNKKNQCGPLNVPWTQDTGQPGQTQDRLRTDSGQRTDDNQDSPKNNDCQD